MRSARPVVILAALLSAGGVVMGAQPSQAATPAPHARVQVTDHARQSAIAAGLRAGTLASTNGVTPGCGKVGTYALLCEHQLVTTSSSSSTPLTSSAPLGYSPAELSAAYRTTHAPSMPGGSIVIIDAGAGPTVESDLAAYRAQYGLPACTTANGCFSQVNFQGGAPYAPTSPDSFDGQGPQIEELVNVETSLDVDMASAACPKCSITEVQVPLVDALGENQAQIEQSAADFTTAAVLGHQRGGTVASISYGLPSDATMEQAAQGMAIPGYAVFGSSGDSGYDYLQYGGESWPAVLPDVIAAGGTSLYSGQRTKTGYAETAWSGGGSFFVSGAGSGCSPRLPAANGQPASIAATCNGHRASSDLSSVADPYTGVAVYDTYAPASGTPYGWLTVGGTSAAAPYLAGLNARAGVPAAELGPNLVYAAPRSALNDITLGSTERPGTCQSEGVSVRLCQAGAGWDGPTGVGSPKGLAPFYQY